MRVKQYVYFALSSETTSAAAIADRVGLASDDADAPGGGSWRIACDAPGLGVDEQIERVVGRLLPFQAEIRRRVEQDDCVAVLQVVRHLGAWLAEGEGEEEETTIELGGQHQLLGWHLGADVLGFLVAVGAELDVDEYG